MKETRPLVRDMGRYIEGDNASAEAICATLEPQVRLAIRGYLPPQDADIDDMIQDVLVAMLQYLRRAKVVPDNPEAFAVTIGKNRCRNLYLWRRRRRARDLDEIKDTLPHIAASPLDLIDETQRKDLLAETLGKLDTECRNLLAALCREETTVENLRRELGLNSVQAVYHRRNVCIKKAQGLLNRRLFDCRGVKDAKEIRSSIGIRRDKESEDG